MDKDENLLAITLRAPHGIKGEFKCFCHFEDINILKQAQTFSLKNGLQLTLKKITQNEKNVIVSFVEINNRTEAEKFSKTNLYIHKSFLPIIQDDESFYIDDLIGMAAYLEDGSQYGTVKTVWNFGAGDILEILSISELDSVMLPFRFEFVPVIELENNRITIILPNFV